MLTKTGIIYFGSALISLALSAYGASRTSANYTITTETIDSAGVNVQSANYALHGSAVGEFGVASTESITSADYVNKIAYVGQLSDMLDPITARSQLTHGGAGTFNVNLPLFVGPRGVECRSSASLGTGNYTVVFTFGNPLTSVGSVSASATGGGPAPGATGAIDNTDAHRYIVTLTNVPNAQYTTVALSNVMDSDANFSSSVQVPMGVLIGDVNGNGVLSNADVSLVKAQVAAGGNVDPAGSNFRDDVNANGVISNADVSLTKAQVAAGAQLPTPP